MTKRELKLLKSFLRSKGAYTKFKLNRKAQGRGTVLNLRICPIAHSMACAFIWGDTPEGREYWRELSGELMDLIESKYY